MLTQIITILILVSIVGCILYGRRLIKTEKVDEWLDIVGLKGFGNTPTYQLS